MALSYAEERVECGETLSLEIGKGQTYQHNEPTLYSLGVYPRSSVLAGQQSRKFLYSWSSYDEARAALDASGLKYDDLFQSGGTSHIPVETMISHLPEEDYDY